MSTYAATKHAVEGYSESLDHEVRGFGIRVITVEPGFTRTNLGHDNSGPERPLLEYEALRQRVTARVSTNIEHGADPDSVAQVVTHAAIDPSPRLRYAVGREARLLRFLRSIAPAALVDQGVRKTFGVAS